MPGMSGIDFLKELLLKHPIPVILVSTLNIRVFDALASGAVDYVKKPDFSDQDAAISFVERLRNKIYVASFSKVRIPQQDTIDTSKPMTVSQGTILKETAAGNLKVPTGSAQKIIAIGASTGGTEALADVIMGFRSDIPGTRSRPLSQLQDIRQSYTAPLLNPSPSRRHADTESFWFCLSVRRRAACTRGSPPS